MGQPEDLDNDDEAESMAGRIPESALLCPSLSFPGLTRCVRNDRCRVKPSGVLCFCATGFKSVQLTDRKFLRVTVQQVHGSANMNIMKFV